MLGVISTLHAAHPQPQVRAEAFHIVFLFLLEAHALAKIPVSGEGGWEYKEGRAPQKSKSKGGESARESAGTHRNLAIVVPQIWI